MTDPTPTPPGGASGMLDRALAEYPEPRSFTLSTTDPETLLETVAEALADSYQTTTFGTAGHLIAELELRGFRIYRAAMIDDFRRA